MINLNTRSFYNKIKEYRQFYKFLPRNFIHKSYNEFCKIYNPKCGLSPDIYYELFIQNKINKVLCNHVRNGNLDLEIILIDKYKPIVDYIFNKLKIGDNKINKEDVIIKSIETYDGAKLFSLHILDVLKKYFINDNSNKKLVKIHKI